jgi:ribosomal protein S18 acetylase RimI-like enzyme
VRAAAPDDEGTLVELMSEFYAEAGFELNRPHATKAFAALLAEERLGQVWLIEADAEPVGYLVLTFGYSMEYGGHAGTLEDLFVRAPFRDRRLGTEAIQELRVFCLARGLRVVSVEVGRENVAAQQVYRRAGFLATDRQLLTMELAKPAHVA